MKVEIRVMLLGYAAINKLSAKVWWSFDSRWRLCLEATLCEYSRLRYLWFLHWPSVLTQAQLQLRVEKILVERAVAGGIYSSLDGD
jgi:hypothetical protein